MRHLFERRFFQNSASRRENIEWISVWQPLRNTIHSCVLLQKVSPLFSVLRPQQKGCLTLVLVSDQAAGHAVLTTIEYFLLDIVGITRFAVKTSTDGHAI